MASIPRSSFELIKPYSHLVDGDEDATTTTLMFTQEDLDVAFNILVAVGRFIKLNRFVITPISMDGRSASFVVLRTMEPIDCGICRVRHAQNKRAGNCFY